MRYGPLYRRSSRGDRLFIPAAGDLRCTVLQELQATPLGGNFGRGQTLCLTWRLVWWPGMPTTLTEHVQTCPTCQFVKADPLPPAGLLFPLPVPSRWGGCISLDFLKPLLGWGRGDAPRESARRGADGRGELAARCQGGGLLFFGPSEKGGIAMVVFKAGLL